MRIYINGRFLTQSITGVQRYAIEIVKQLDNMIDQGTIDKNELNIILLTPKKSSFSINLKHIPILKIGKYKGHLWEQLVLPICTRNDLLLNLCNTGPILKKNQIVTIHDAAVFSTSKTYSYLFTIWYKIMYRFISKYSKLIITDSYFSKGELINYLSINEKKVEVVYLGNEHIIQLESDLRIIAKHNLHDKPYVLAVSSLSPNKNFKSITQALEILGDENFDAVIVGGVNPKVFSQSQISFPKRIKYLGYVSDSELKSLYENASCFVYPSFYEGFGLPPLEAMTCGSPIIVSNTASLPEIYKEAAIYCDPYNPKDIAEKIKKVMTDRNFRIKMRSISKSYSHNYSWEKTALDILSLITKGKSN